MKKEIIKILKLEGPMLSGELAKKIKMKYNTTNENARQIISRAKSPVQKLKTINFSNRQRYVYLEEQYNKEKYKDNLYEALKKAAKNYYQILIAIENNGGFISKKVLASYVSAPVKDLKGHLRYDKLIENLINLGFIDEFDDEYYQLLYPLTKLNISRTKALEFAQKQVISDLNNLMRNLNLVAYNSSKTFFQEAEFAKFQWAFSSPSYITGLFNKKNNKLGFFICDIKIGKKLIEEDIKFFIDKLDIIKNFKKLSNFTPIIVASSYDKETHQKLKEKGIVVSTVKDLFSEKYVELLEKLIEIMTNSAAIISKNPKILEELAKENELLKGKMGNLFGDLFEISVGYYFFNLGCKYLDMNKIIEFQKENEIKKTKREIDIYVEKNNKLIIVECKGRKNYLNFEETEKYLKEKIPIIYEGLRKNNSNQEIVFELWSTGGFSEEALKLLEEYKEKIKKYKISYFNKNEIEEKAKKSNCEILKKSIKSIFSK